MLPPFFLLKTQAFALQCRIDLSTMLLECKIGLSTTLLECKIGPSATLLSFTRKSHVWIVKSMMVILLVCHTGMSNLPLLFQLLSVLKRLDL